MARQFRGRSSKAQGRVAHVYSWPEVSLPALPGAPQPLQLFDTATRSLKSVEVGSHARMYVCGITPYDATHIGHAATYLTFDLINRQWRDQGAAVSYVQNVTDIDDPLLERASATGVDWRDLATDQIQLFRDDMTALRILPPTSFVSVVESIEDVAIKVRALLDSGAAYYVDQDIYFDVTSDPNFGQVGHYDAATELAYFAERGGDPDRPGKRNQLDCLLWRGTRDGEPSWDSVVGSGRPGWHIECVAIALDHLGMSFDVQGGGNDLIFPHHEMSASQGQVLTGEQPYAKAYVHAGLVALDGEKMSKSRGNLVFVSKLLESGVDEMAIRLALLQNHYRTDWEWTDSNLHEAQARLNRWREAVAPPTGPSADETLAAVRKALAGDLDTTAAIAAIDRWAEHQATTPGDDPGAPGIISRTTDALLGIAL